jgi:hypothetical protein
VQAGYAMATEKTLFRTRLTRKTISPLPRLTVSLDALELSSEKWRRKEIWLLRDTCLYVSATENALTETGTGQSDRLRFRTLVALGMNDEAAAQDEFRVDLRLKV